jgi:predicted nucleic acid-binding protein
VRFVATNVISALRIRGRNPAAERWAASVRVSDQFVTAMTIAEVERGVPTLNPWEPLTSA